MTVSTLLRSLDSSELSEWQAYHNLERYEAKFREARLSAEERSHLIIKSLFGDPDKWRN